MRTTLGVRAGVSAIQWLHQEAKRRDMLASHLARQVLCEAFPEFARLNALDEATPSPFWNRPDWTPGTDPVTGRPDPFSPEDGSE